jgi:hypothetical protein
MILVHVSPLILYSVSNHFRYFPLIVSSCFTQAHASIPVWLCQQPRQGRPVLGRTSQQREGKQGKRLQPEISDHPSQPAQRKGLHRRRWVCCTVAGVFTTYCILCVFCNLWCNCILCSVPVVSGHPPSPDPILASLAWSRGSKPSDSTYSIQSTLFA